MIAVCVGLPSVKQDYAMVQLLNKPSYKSESSDLKQLTSSGLSGICEGRS